MQSLEIDSREKYHLGQNKIKVRWPMVGLDRGPNQGHHVNWDNDKNNETQGDFNKQITGGWILKMIQMRDT